MAATRGAYGKIYQEIAGLALSGIASFCKAEAEGQVSRAVEWCVCFTNFRLMSLTSSGLHKVSVPSSALGLAMALGPGRARFSDRFQLGGV